MTSQKKVESYLKRPLTKDEAKAFTFYNTGAPSGLNRRKLKREQLKAIKSASSTK